MYLVPSTGDKCKIFQNTKEKNISSGFIRMHQGIRRLNNCMIDEVHERNWDLSANKQSASSLQSLKWISL